MASKSRTLVAIKYIIKYLEDKNKVKNSMVKTRAQNKAK